LDEELEPVFQKLHHWMLLELWLLLWQKLAIFFDPSTRKLDLSHPNIQNDIQNPTTPKTLFGYLARGLYLCQQAKCEALYSSICDNIQGNGDLVKSLLLNLSSGLSHLVSYINEQVAFPNSMVDRITPAASQNELNYLHQTLQNHIRQCSSYFWIPILAYGSIENNYCNDVPPWGICWCSISSLLVKPYEKIKVRLLNAGHSSIGYSGHLAGFELIYQVASDAIFQR